MLNKIGSTHSVWNWPSSLDSTRKHEFFRNFWTIKDLMSAQKLYFVCNFLKIWPAFDSLLTLLYWFTLGSFFNIKRFFQSLTKRSPAMSSNSSASKSTTGIPLSPCRRLTTIVNKSLLKSYATSVMTTF